MKTLVLTFQIGTDKTRNKKTKTLNRVNVSYNGCPELHHRCTSKPPHLVQIWITMRRISTLPCPSFPASQHLAHSQLLGRSSSTTPEWVSCGFNSFKHFGWKTSQQILHSIRLRSSRITSSDASSLFPPSPSPHFWHTAWWGSSGWKINHHHYLQSIMVM